MPLFLELPRELRDRVYVYLLQDWHVRCSSKAEGPDSGPFVLDMGIRNCFIPKVLRINRQIKAEYFAIAQRHACLDIELSLSTITPGLTTFDLPGLHWLSSHLEQPLLMCNFPSSLAIHLNDFVDFSFATNHLSPQWSLDQLLADLPALRNIDVTVSMFADRIEAHCPPELTLPSVEEFVLLPLPAGTLKRVTSHLEFTMKLFEQNRSYRWPDAREARLVGEMAMRAFGVVRMIGKPSRGPYAWRGMDLDWEVFRSWADLRQESIRYPLHTQSPYVT